MHNSIMSRVHEYIPPTDITTEDNSLNKM